MLPATTLPADFILHLPYRHIATSFVRMKAFRDTNGVYHITRRSDKFNVTQELDYVGEPPSFTVCISTALNKQPVETVVQRTPHRLVELVDGVEADVPVFTFNTVELLVKRSIPKNINVIPGAEIISKFIADAAALADDSVPVYSPSPQVLSPDITIVPAVTHHVAAQLLSFARSKHETCPITSEEFAEGSTAVMPCGHLFAKDALTETFKSETNKCPECRQYGMPTVV
jgi:hypothetical protein